MDVFAIAEAKNLIGLNRSLLSMKPDVYREHGKTPAKVNEHPVVFAYNTLLTLISHADLPLNGTLISQSNSCSFHDAFVEPELKIDREGKQTKTQCQGCGYLEKTCELNQEFTELYEGFER